MIFGLDYLGGAKYERIALRNLPAGWALGLFANTFGDSRSLAAKALARGHIVRVHLIWKDDHKFGRAEIAAAVKEAKRWRALSDQHGTALRISPWCEHRAKKDVLAKLHAAIMNELPNCLYVNAPISGGDYLRGVTNETHHGMKALSQPYNFSFDGVDCCDADAEGFKEAHSSSDLFFFWTSRFNGKWEPNDPTPRPKRKGWPDDKMCQSVIALAKTKEAVSLPSGEIYKSHGENDGDGNPRAEKMVYISKHRASKVELINAAGKVVDTLTPSGQLEDRRYVYRSRKWGYELAKTASVCRVKMNGKIIGSYDPIFRQNAYRNKG